MGGGGAGLDLGCQAVVGGTQPWSGLPGVGLGKGSVQGRGDVPLEVMPPCVSPPWWAHIPTPTG